MLRPDAFGRRLLLVALGALAVRVVAALATNDHLVQGDAMTFHQVAQHLADGEGFRRPFVAGPTAEHPPAWELVLAAADKLGAGGYLAHRLIGAVLGTVTVVLIGLLGRAVAGARVGLVAALIAAVYPMLWTADVSLMSETLYGVFLTGALVAAVHRRALWLGVLLALAALTRGEALLLVPLLAVPLLWRAPRSLAVCVLAFAVVLAPWTIRNLTKFDRPVLISNNANGLWVGANCGPSYRGPLTGYWVFQCYTAPRRGEDEADYFARQRSIGVRYLRDHSGRLPAVLGVRVLRVFDAWNLPQSVFINAQEGRAPRPVKWGIRSAWLVMALALAGAFLVRRERLVLLAPVALVVIVALITYGTTRFRFAAEPSLCVLAAVTLVALARRAQHRAGEHDGDERERGQLPVPVDA